MIRPIPVLLSIAAILSSRPAPGQESRWATLRADADNMADDIVHVWTSPFRADGRDLVAFAGLTGALVAVGIFDDEIQDWIREHPGALPVRALGPLRESQPLSLIGYTRWLATLSGAAYITGLALDIEPLREAGIGCLTSDIANTLARHLLARLVGRLRPQFTRDPYVIVPFAWGDWPMRSFPGGHVANIMACSTFWSNHFDLGIASVALYLFSAGIGFGRVIDQAHWTTDTLFGLVFGWSVGRNVADRFAERAAPARDPATAGVPAPMPRITLAWRIRF